MTNNFVSGIDNKIQQQDTLTGQLIDFNLDTNQSAADTVNFNNNSLLNTSSTPLVTSDSHENKGKHGY